MIGELERIAGQCDGVRCDMAMLILPDVFERTWGIRPELFWPTAVESVRRKNPDFRFMAEVYWDLEWALQQLGFDYTYDKRLYDRLVEGHARPVREHLLAGSTSRIARPASSRTTTSRGPLPPSRPRCSGPPRSSRSRHPACASSTRGSSKGAGSAFRPTSSGASRIHGPGTRAVLSPSALRSPKARCQGRGVAVLSCRPAWDGNGSWDSFVAHSWRAPGGERMLIAVNYASHHSQCYVDMPFSRDRRPFGPARGLTRLRLLRPRWKRTARSRTLPRPATVVLPRV